MCAPRWAARGKFRNHGRLKQEFERKLDQARIIYGGVKRSEPGRAEFRTGGADAAAGGTELWMIEQIEDLRAEIQPHPLAPGQHEMLDRREVGIDEVGAR